MTRWISCGLMLVGSSVIAAWADPPKDVPSHALAEIARRGALVERISATGQGETAAAVASAMQPPADDSHKWLFTLVVTRNCSWCERARRDFESDAKLKAWVDTADYERSWAHWQVVQIEDPSQAWRWRDFRPTAFPTLIVQPPVNGNWGDSHTIVFARQGYLKPTELDEAIRQAIGAYASKVQPRRQPSRSSDVEQAAPDAKAGFNPPAPPPLPLAPTPVIPAPPMPAMPYPAIPPQDVAQPNVGGLLAQLLAGLIGGPAVANLLLLAILAWQVYRGIARREGIPLFVDDQTAAEITDLVRGRRSTDVRPARDPQTGGNG